MLMAFSRSHSGVGDLEDRLARIDRCAVDEYMDAPQALGQFFEGGVGALPHGNIAAGGGDFGAETFQDSGGFGEALLVLVDQADLRGTSLDHQFRGGEAEARSAAHDDRCLSFHWYALAI
ncbi:hypothetical protein ABIA22_005891 [Sinorhizobium fredii]